MTAQTAQASLAAAGRRPILEAAGITKRFVKRLDLAGKVAQRLGSAVREETVHAVDGVDLTVGDGEVVGLVGETGCGKSPFGRMVAGILDRKSVGEGKSVSGSVEFGGSGIIKKKNKKR